MKADLSRGSDVWHMYISKIWSNNQAAVALSLGEVEYNSVVKTGSVSLGIKALTSELDIESEDSIEMNSDASASTGISNRVRLGEVRHIEVMQLPLKEKVRNENPSEQCEHRR